MYDYKAQLLVLNVSLLFIFTVDLAILRITVACFSDLCQLYSSVVLSSGNYVALKQMYFSVLQLIMWAWYNTKMLS